MKKLIPIFLFSAFVFFVGLGPLYSQVSFEQHLVDGTTHGMGSVYACDIDGDQDNDILTASLEDDEIIWFRNDGGKPLNWTKIIVASNVVEAHSVYAADFDNDNDLDIVGAAYQGQPGIAWWRNDGGNPITWTKFPVANTFINAHEVYAADINNDQHIDVLGASSDLHKIAVWYNSGNDSITWTEQPLITNFTLAKSVRAGDFDDDGDIDVIGASIVDNDVVWWRNDNGNPINWTKFNIDLNFSGAHRVDTADIDGDGKLDVVGAGYGGNIIGWWKNNIGNTVPWIKQIIEYNFNKACIAYASDMDRDGDQDILGTSQEKGIVALWLNNGGDPVQWTKVIVDSNFYRVWPLYASDMDGDGDKDIVAGSSHQGNNQMRWYENLGDTATSVKSDDETYNLKGFNLQQNYPNPFNPSTNISWQSPISSWQTLKVYDVLGNEISTLVNEEKPAGNYHVDFNASTLSSGIYFYIVTSGNRTMIKKMIFMK